MLFAKTFFYRAPANGLAFFPSIEKIHSRDAFPDQSRKIAAILQKKCNYSTMRNFAKLSMIFFSPLYWNLTVATGLCADPSMLTTSPNPNF